MTGQLLTLSSPKSVQLTHLLNKPTQRKKFLLKIYKSIIKMSNLGKKMSDTGYATTEILNF